MLVYALGGMFIYLLLDLYGLQKATPNLNFIETVKEYFSKNLFPIIANIIIIYLAVDISQSGELTDFGDFEFLIVNSKAGALMLGLSSQTVMTGLRRIIFPMQVVTEGSKIV